MPDADVVVLDPDDGLADAAVAAIGLSGVAAWAALGSRAQLQPGECVLVLGAGGAVGQAGIGAARAMGAGRVVAVCRPGAAVTRARQAGADAVVELGPDADELVTLLAEAVGGAADVVLDPVFGAVATAASRVLAPGGRLVNLGSVAGDTAEFASALLRSRSASVLGYTNNALGPDERATALRAVLARAAAGELTVAHETLPLRDVRRAWERAAAGSGDRLVLVPD